MSRVVLCVMVMTWATTGHAAENMVNSPSVTVQVSDDGEIVRMLLGPQRLEKAVRACTRLAGSRVEGAAMVKATDGGIAVKRSFTDDQGAHRCVVTDRFTPTDNSVRWEIEIQGDGAPWSAPIETRVAWPDAANAAFWTAWSDPTRSDTAWNDPLVFRPLDDAHLYYGAPPFQDALPLAGYCPVFGNTFCIPMVTVADLAQDAALSLVLSPENDLLDIELTTTTQGEITFSRLNHRIAPDHPVRFAMDLAAHPADWRAALGWVAARYPRFFDPPNPRADAMAGCGAYSAYEGALDVKRFMNMAFRVNWKASFDFPYMGMFLPPVKDDAELWPRFSGETAGGYTRTCVNQMNAYSAGMRAAGFRVLSYFNVTEFGNGIHGPNAVNANVSPDDLWKRANDFLFRKIEDGILHSESGKVWPTWGGAIAMDPGGPNYQAFLIEQARRHIEKIPASSGICIDRLDWLRFYNPRADDGISWRNGKPYRSLLASWKSIMGKLSPIMHQADKVIFVNNHLKRIDLLPEVDGIYCEFANNGRALNATAFLTVCKPAIGWTAAESDLKPDPDALFQRHLHLGVFPTAPFPGNDHTITPSPWAEQYYLDYGPLFDALRGKKWVLQPHVIEVEGQRAKANLFEVPGGYVVPVTFGGEAASVKVILRNLGGKGEEGKRGKGKWAVDLAHPGTSEWTTLGTVNKEERVGIDVALQRGCAVVRLSEAWIKPRTLWFETRAAVEMGATIDGAELRYTLDGADPGATAKSYNGPITVEKTTEVKMAVFVNGRQLGRALTAEYVKVAPSAPTILPQGRCFEESVAVEIQKPDDDNGEVRYTLDGADPTMASPLYAAPVTLTHSATVKARVFVPGAGPGAVAAAAFSVVPPRPPLPDVSIADLTPLKAIVGWGDGAKRNLSIQGNPLSLCGKRHEKGMGVHAVSELIYELRPEYQAFVAVVGVDDEMNTHREASVVFQVFADEQRLCETPVLHSKEYWHVLAEIPRGAQQLRLVVTDAGDGVNCDHADWADAGFTVGHSV